MMSKRAGLFARLTARRKEGLEKRRLCGFYLGKGYDLPSSFSIAGYCGEEGDGL